MTGKKKDSFFNPERRCASDISKIWMKGIIGEATSYEASQGLRQRKRRLTDQRRFEEQIEALVSDVAYTMLYAPKGRSSHVCLSLSKQRIGPKQHGHRLVNSVLGNTLNLLSEDGIGVFKVSKGSIKTGLQTIIQPSRRLQVSIRRHGLSTDDFRTIKEDPLVQLRVRNSATQKQRLEKLDLSDPEVARMTQELIEINSFLETAWIEYHATDDTVDERNRRLHRVFNQSLKRNGLAYGGFWTGISKADRLAYLYIDDEPCVEIDLNSATLKIAYALSGKTDMRDLYEIPRLKALGRERLKKYTLMYLSGGRYAFSRPLPKAVHRLLRLHEEESNERVLTQMLTQIKEHHREISQYFNPDKAGELTYILGEIMVLTVLRLTRSGIVALPVTDAIYVKESVQEYARQVLEQCFLEKTNNQNLRTEATL
jgi:hypothetical protein